MADRKKYWRKRSLKLKRYRNRFKSNQKCAECDNTTNLVFHHVNPKSKEKVISKLGTKKAIRKEIRKTILLCPKHHSKAHKI